MSDFLNKDNLHIFTEFSSLLWNHAFKGSKLLENYSENFLFIGRAKVAE